MTKASRGRIVLQLVSEGQKAPGRRVVPDSSSQLQIGGFRPKANLFSPRSLAAPKTVPSVGGGAAVYSRLCARSARLLGGPSARWAIAEERNASATLRTLLRRSRLRVAPFEVAALSYLVALVAALGGVALVAWALLIAHLPPLQLALSVVLPTAILPLLLSG